jgi:NADH-quinone oxidoreductase subunit A
MNFLPTTATAAALAGERPAQSWDYVSIGVYALMVIVILGVLMFLATWLGGRRPDTEKDRPYESGVIPTGIARLRLPVQFYLVAIFFIIFDLEAVFVYAWAVAFDLLGWPGYIYISFFIAALFAGLVYVWKKGGLEWGPKGK